MLPYRQFSAIPGVDYTGMEFTGGDQIWHVACFTPSGSLDPGMDEVARGSVPFKLDFVFDTCTPSIYETNLQGGVCPVSVFHTLITGINVPGGLPVSDTYIVTSFVPGSIHANRYQAELFEQGILGRAIVIQPTGQPDSEGEEFKFSIAAGDIKFYYFNPVVSAFSHYALRTGEQVDFVLTGLGFNQSNAEIDQGGPSKPSPYWKSYVTEIEFWQVGVGGGDWEDDFEDGARDPAWSDDPNNGTIDEAGGKLIMAIANGVNGDFWGVGNNGPVTWVTPGMDKITVETKLNSYPVNDGTYAGIYITDAINGNNGIHFSRTRHSGVGRNGLRIMDMGAFELAYVAETTLPIWLKVEIEESGAGSTMVFKYSTNGTDWLTLYTKYGETWDKIGLLVRNKWASSYNAISAPFEFFKYSWEEPAPVSTLKLTDGDFTLVSDTQITIPKSKFPELSMGTYRLNLRKTVIDIEHGLAEAWAGAWKPDEIGLCTAGAALILRVGLMPSIGVRGKAKALPLTCFTWKNKLGETYEDCVAPIDIRAPETFYDGRIIDVSSVTRAIDHRTGLFQISDMTIRLVNTDKKYSKLLANWFLKNQPINLWLATGFEPEAAKTPIVGMIVEDYHLQGTEFVVKLKDITQKYFKKKIPPRICTKLTFPQIHPDEIGKAFPEVLGLCVLGTAFEEPGAVQAIYTDTLVYEYLAANGELFFVSNVFSDGEPQTPPADYSIVYRDGCTFIDFVADQEDKKITFNAKGYAVGGLNSVNGYIQNPAYIILYYLSNILEVPDELLNTTSFDALASKYDDLGVGESGKLIIQTRQDSMEVLRQLLFSYGVHGFPANDGRFVVERKDIFNYATETFLFDQIDLMDSPLREFNLTEAINTIKARWDYIPWQRLFKDAGEDYKDNKFEADMEDDVRMPREREDRRTRWL